MESANITLSLHLILYIFQKMGPWNKTTDKIAFSPHNSVLNTTSMGSEVLPAARQNSVSLSPDSFHRSHGH
jgi:hypothetical protein